MPRRDRPTQSGLAAWEAFLHTHRALVARLDHDLVERHGLPLVWYDVLFQLHASGGETTMGELASRLVLAPSTCTRLIGRMAAAGLVERRVDADDARIRHAALTADGRARLKAAAITHLAGVQRHFGRFLDDEQALMFVDRFDAMGGSAAND